MKFYKNILEKIGKTPLIQLNNINKGLKPQILIKSEMFNPGGSAKDRIAIAMINAAEKEGLLKPGGTIIEPTSGNTGLGLAMVGNLKGYKLIFTMPDKMSQEKEDILTAYGAKVIRTPTNVAPDDPKSYYEVAKKLVREIPNSFSPNQYFNQNNPNAHYQTTGPEIWNDTNGKISHFVCGIGTGGTISGSGKFLKEQNQRVKIIGVDTVGSIYSHLFYETKGPIHSYLTEGIGEDFLPETVDLKVIDDIIQVSDKMAFKTAREFVLKESILIGSSSGAAIYAGLKLAKSLSENDIMVILLPDTGKSYLSTLFNDSWMAKNNLLD